MTKLNDVDLAAWNARADELDLPHLTIKEAGVATLLAEGWTVAAIAESNRTTTTTVYTHKINLRNKFGLTTDAELLARLKEKKDELYGLYMMELPSEL